MGHIPEDEKNDEFMNASAEEWSKPEEPEAAPESQPEPTDRWGSPIPDPDGGNNPERWESETKEPIAPQPPVEPKKSASKWWIVALIVVLVLCLCACVLLVGLPLLGVSIFESNLITY